MALLRAAAAAIGLALVLGGLARGCRGVGGGRPLAGGGGRGAPLLARLADAVSGVGLLRRDRAAAMVQARCCLLEERSWVSRTLRHHANPTGPVASPRMTGLRALCLAAAAAVALPLAAVAGVPVPIAGCVVLAGVALPDLALASAARPARRRLEEAQPELLDLLASCARAGLALDEALVRAAAVAEPPLAGVLARAVARTGAGEEAAAALRLESERVADRSLAAAATAMAHHRRRGLPVEELLRRHADRARERLDVATTLRAGRAASIASLIGAAVVTPACVAALALAVLGAALRAGVV